MFAVVGLTTSSVMSVDAFFDLSSGRLEARSGLPHTDDLTVAGHGRPWIDQQWLAHEIFYGAWRAGGYAALAILSAALVGTAFAVTAMTLRRRGVSSAAAAVPLALALAVCLPTAIIWSQSFALPLFAVTLGAVIADADGRPRPWRLASVCLPVLVLWANLHGSVLLGAAGVAVYAAARGVQQRRWQYAAVAAGTACTPLATPYGAAIVDYYRSVLANPVISSRLDAWSPAGPGTPASYPFLVMLAVTAAVVALAWRKGRHPRPAAGIAALVLAAAGLRSLRYEDWFALAGCVVLAQAATRVEWPGGAIRPRMRRVLARFAIAAGAAACVILATRPATSFERAVPRGAITAAAAYATAHPQARILADTTSATALLWLDPAVAGRVGFDSRIEIFRPAAAAAWLDFNSATAPDWARVLRGYDVIVASRVAHPVLARRAGRLSGWDVVWSDSSGVVLVRRA